VTLVILTSVTQRELVDACMDVDADVLSPNCPIEQSMYIAQRLLHTRYEHVTLSRSFARNLRITGAKLALGAKLIVS
jgi:hypothetical protein